MKYTLRLLSLLLLPILLQACGSEENNAFDVYVWQNTRRMPIDHASTTIYKKPFEINFLVHDFSPRQERQFRIDYAATFNQSDVQRFKEAKTAYEAVADSAERFVPGQAMSNQLITGSSVYTGLLFDNISGLHSFRGFRKEPTYLQADLDINSILDENLGERRVLDMSASELHLIFTFVEIDPATKDEKVLETERLLIKFQDL